MQRLGKLNLEYEKEAELIDNLKQIYGRDRPPEPEVLLQETLAAIEVLDNEPQEIRPRDREGHPGGLLYLDPQIPTVVLPICMPAWS
jgi:hypothetical protein